ncbi:MAG: N-formylglutamate amidohydrolase [Thermoanaerobaculia bacterium]|nr:N-formylglutamate amidohydrolase [Thermoanaerobaculia bacterium]
MSGSRLEPLLADDEPAPVEVDRPDAPSPYFLTCDHGGHRLPRSVGDLGITTADLHRHIGWDIGALAVARRISERLDATLVAQIYSRLVIDCNRRPGTPPSIPLVSEGTRIPGNEGLTAEERRQREDALHRPYHNTIDRLLDARRRRGQPSVLVAMHSFTPVFEGVPRRWHITFSTDDDRRLGDRLLADMRRTPDLLVGDNEPYTVNDIDYTIPVHGAQRGLVRILVEMRQDLIAEEAGQEWWATRLGDALEDALPGLVAEAPAPTHVGGEASSPAT